MTGYVRQSLADIVTGEVILALPLNNEFNAIQAAFHATTGHTHDGSTANGPKINLTTSVTGVLPVGNGGTGGLVSVDNTVPRFNGTNGTLQTSGVVISDLNGISGVTTLDLSTTSLIPMTITSVDSGATAGPILLLDRNSSSPIAGDILGYIGFLGRNSTATSKTYADIYTVISDPVNGTEDGTLIIRVISGGTVTQQAAVSATGWNGMNIGTTTPGTGAFTTLSASGAFSLTGDVVQVSEGGTGVGTFTAGLLVGNGTSALISRVLTAPAAGITITNGSGVAGNPTLALANDLLALEGLASTGIAVRTATDTWAQRTITTSGAGLNVTNGDGVSGNPVISLINDLSAIEALSGAGIAVRTAADTWAQRTITGTANEIDVTNGNGVSGNPVISLPAAITMTGHTLTGGTYTDAVIENSSIGLTTPSTGSFTTLTTSGVVNFNNNNNVGPIITSTNAGATVGPTFTLFRDSASPANNDQLGYIAFNGRNSGAAQRTYFDFFATASNVTAGAETANAVFRLSVAGTIINVMTLSSTGINNTVIGATTPNTGSFTTLNSTGGALNGTVGAITPNTVAATTITASSTLDVTGVASFVAPVRLSNGSAATPSVAFTADPTKGIYNGGANTVGLAIGGVSVGLITNTGLNSMAIGATTPSTGSFTNLNATGTFALTGDQVQVSEGGTGVATITGLVSGNGTSALVGRTITGTANEITVTNGNGATANPTLSLPTALTFTGKTVTGGTFSSAAFNGTLGATTPSTVSATTITASGQIGAAAGAVGTPSISFSGDTNTGFYSLSADVIGFAAGGNLVATLSGSNFTLADNISITLGSLSPGSYIAGSFSATGATIGKQLSQISFDQSTSGTASTKMQRFYNPNGEVGSISTSGSSTAYTTSSDENLKDFIGEYDPNEAFRIILSDPVRDFIWKKSKEYAVGWGAQTSYRVSPDLAVPGHGEPGDEDYNPWSIDQSKRTPYLWAAVGELIKRVQRLEAKIEVLENGQN